MTQSARLPALLGIGVTACAALLLLPSILLPVNLSYLAAVALATSAVALVAATEAGRVRLVYLNLFVWALSVRLGMVSACYYLGLREGGPFLGPDSTTYFRVSLEFARRSLHLDTIPLLHFGSYDVSPYYLYAAAIRYLGADLFGLQVLNGGFVALATVLSYGLARMLIASVAPLVGVVVALHPSLIVLSSVDLLKDPSILCASMLLLWAVIRLAREEDPWRVSLIAAVGSAGALYLRTGRFYAFAYIEAAFVCALVAAGLAAGRRVFVRRLGLPLVVLMFAFAEIAPMTAGWRSSPALVAAHVTFVANSDVLGRYSAGLIDQLSASSQLSGRSRQPRNGSWTAPGDPGNSHESSPGFGLLALGANLFRRVYGPFPWIAPSMFTFKALQTGDFLLYPGMLIWYAILPMVVSGLIALPGLFARGTPATGLSPRLDPQARFSLLFLWVFVVVYLAQYLTINLSYRQRDVMTPVLLLFAWVGFDRLRRYRGSRRLYALYWAILGLIASGHLLLRATMQT
jgi:hypothetical protein